MTKARIKISAQDVVLQAIANAAKAQNGNPDVAAEIRTIGAALADKWGAKHPELPDTRRDAAS